MKNLNKFYFSGKAADETVIIALRRHAMAIIKQIFFLVFLMIVITVILFLLNFYTKLLSDKTSLVYALIVLGASIFYLYILLLIYHAWVDYYLDIWIVTNERVISIEQKGLFHRDVSELRLDKIQDVSSDTKGILPTVFKYGNLQVQTASEQDKFNFTEVPQPEWVASQILQLHEQYLNSHPGLASQSLSEKTTSPQNNPPNQTDENKLV
jgi:uncharacterized membrane protein YdbT with pleckstrin-like domain